VSPGFEGFPYSPQVKGIADDWQSLLCVLWLDIAFVLQWAMKFSKPKE
jgi:hypothetical protein